MMTLIIAMLIFIGGLVLGDITNSWLVAILMIGGSFVYTIKAVEKDVQSAAGIKKLPKLSKEEIARWNDTVSAFPYKHFWNGFGIAFDLENKKVHLKGFLNDKAIEKVYSFNDIREWKYSVSSGGGVSVFNPTAVGAVGAALSNSVVFAKNEEATGFFIKVRDIDIPEWQIRFSAGQQREMELKRWMEIFQQHIAEAKN